MRHLALATYLAAALWALDLTVLAGCGGAPARPIARAAAGVTPARDLAAARVAVPPPDRRERDARAARDPRVVDLDILRITAHTSAPGAEPELTSVATADLFQHAGAAARAGRRREAIGLYRQLVAEFPESQYAPVALFNIAALYDGEADLTATITALQELVDRYPESRESVEGHLYMAALQADHQQWAEAAATLDAALARPHLTYADRVEALARRGYVELEQHRNDAAEASLSAAVAEWRKAPRIDDPYYIAMAHYYRGELMHRRFADHAVRTGDDEMVADLEAKRVLAAQAYDRWREALRFHQAYWATAAGYQMSQIFVELWEAHVQAPYPHRIDVAIRPTYVADVHTRVRPDLEKALEGHRMNAELAKAYGVETPWSRGSERQAAAIMELLARDAPGSYVAPGD
jgi:predicted negative regulator of RcsB-dependent stress response